MSKLKVASLVPMVVELNVADRLQFECPPTELECAPPYCDSVPSDCTVGAVVNASRNGPTLPRIGRSNSYSHRHDVKVLMSHRHRKTPRLEFSDSPSPPNKVAKGRDASGIQPGSEVIIDMT